MDPYQATSMVFAKLQALEPEIALRIMGYILIQDPGENEMKRLALGPDSSLQNLILQAKSCFGISSNSLSSPSSSPTPVNPISRPNSIKNPFSSLTSPRMFNNTGFNSTNPSLFSTDFRNPNGSMSNNCPISPGSGSGLNSSAAATAAALSYAAAVANNSNGSGVSGTTGGSSSLMCSDSVFNQSGGGGGGNNIGGGDMFDEFQFQDHLSFLNEAKNEELMFDDPRSEMLIDNGNPNNPFHRRSVSLNDACYGGGGFEDDGSGFGGIGGGFRPCMYFNKGFCKNGSTCNFRHGGFGDPSDVSAIVGSPSKLDAFEQSQEILRSRAAAQQQRMAVASQLMSSASFPYNKCMNFFNDSPRSAAAAALMMGDEFHKFSRCRSDSAMGLGGINPVSRQIYLTFPADSTFREEDVSNYFSIYGQVQDVRIPYQQKRMFGFVTFVYPETVKLILAKGNPHFVCDSRVLVKPYKEKGKVDKKQYQQQQQQFERGELSGCPSPREPYDIHIGPRMFYNAQELMLRRKIEEQADLQQAIELQGRRMMNLQLLDIKNHQQSHQFQQNLSPIDPFSLRISPPSDMNHNLIPSDIAHQELSEVDDTILDTADQQVHHDLKMVNQNEKIDCENGIAKEESSKVSEFDHNESLERTFLPDNLFASPTKSAGNHKTLFAAPTTKETDETSTNTTTLLAPPKPCFFELPRYSSGHEAIEM